MYRFEKIVPDGKRTARENLIGSRAVRFDGSAELVGRPPNWTENRKSLVHRITFLSAALMSFCLIAATSSAQTLITNVNVLDGTSDKLASDRNVLTAKEDATVIDDDGRTLMPGLSDRLVHIGFAPLPQAMLFTGRPGYNYIYSVGDA